MGYLAAQSRGKDSENDYGTYHLGFGVGIVSTETVTRYFPGTQRAGWSGPWWQGRGTGRSSGVDSHESFL